MNKRKRFFIILGSIVVFLFLLSLIHVIGDFFSFISFNVLAFVDNYFCLWSALNPLFLWAFIFIIIGAIWGIFVATNKFKLKPQFKVYCILGIVLFVVLVAFISRPAFYPTLIQLNDKRHWDKAKSENTYEAFKRFLSEDPNTIFQDSAEMMLDCSLWRTAREYKTYDWYTTYINENPHGKFLDSARIYQEKALWWLSQIT